MDQSAQVVDAPAQPVLERLRSHRASVYACGKVPGDHGKIIDAFPAGITQQRGAQLAGLLRQETAIGGVVARTIETGFALGLSALFILEAGLESFPSGSVMHTAIDPFQRRDWNNAGLRMVREAGVSAHVRVLEEDSALVLPSLAIGGEQFDAAFVDGSHLFDGALIDISYMLRLVRPGGLIILDDYWMPAIRAAVDFFVTNLGLRLVEHPDDKGRTRLVSLRVPQASVSRAWDHFVAFGSK